MARRPLSIAGIALLAAFLLVLSFPSASADITRPPALHYLEMVYDSESDRVVLYGGYGGGDSDETWTYDYNANVWERKSPSVAPPPRDAFALAYDVESDRAILFGGTFGFTDKDDTWAYDLNSDTWTQMNPSVSPAPRRGHQMVYDAGLDRIVLFGGEFPCFGETWTYDYNNDTWTEMAPTGAPSARVWHAMEYDEESQQTVLFGGDPCTGPIEEDDFSDTWAYDLANDSWMLTSPGPPPTKRGLIGTAYDSESDRIVLFGGWGEGPNETWEYDLNSNTWTERTGLPAPSLRNAHAMTYDAESDRTVLFGGSWPPGSVVLIPPNDETWGYDLNLNAWSPLLVLPTEPLGLEASPGEGQMELTWTPPSFEGSHPISEYRIYRETGGLALTLLASGVTDPVYTDDDVVQGSAYLYEIRAVNAVGEGPPSERVGGPFPDTTDPIVTITSPSADATLDALQVTVSGSASDNIGVQRVELSTDGVTWTDAVGRTQWEGTLTLSEGMNTIHARATDTSDNVAQRSIPVTVELAPEPDGDFPWLLVGGSLAALGAGLGVVVYVLRRKRGR